VDTNCGNLCTTRNGEVETKGCRGAAFADSLYMRSISLVPAVPYRLRYHFKLEADGMFSNAYRMLTVILELIFWLNWNDGYVRYSIQVVLKG
jgi:hypothetical protein